VSALLRGIGCMVFVTNTSNLIAALLLDNIFRQHFFKVLVQIPYSQQRTGGQDVKNCSSCDLSLILSRTNSPYITLTFMDKKHKQHLYIVNFKELIAQTALILCNFMAKQLLHLIIAPNGTYL